MERGEHERESTVSGETFLILLRLALSLSIVFGLMWLAARTMKSRANPLKRMHGGNLEVIERKALGKNSSIAIVRIADQTMAVAITESQITSLGNVDLPEIAIEAYEVPEIVVPIASLEATAGRGSLIEMLRDMTVRHTPSR